MDEHLLGVKINDQKAHLQKVLEEVRIANAELTKTFVQVDEAKKELESVITEIAGAKAVLANTREEKLALEADCEHIVNEAKRTWDEAQQKLQDASADVTVAEIRAELIVSAAEARVEKLTEEIERLEGFIESANSQAASITADLGSLEQQKLDVLKEIKEHRDEKDKEATSLEASVKEKRSILNQVLADIDLAEHKLDKARQTTDNLFKNLEEREQRVKVGEEDNNILRGRLRFLIEEQNKKLND